MKGFVVGGAEVVESGVSAAGVAEALDPLEHCGRELGPGVPGCAVEEFALHDRPEALAEGVVNGRGDAPHRSEQAGLPESVTEEPGGVLRSLSA